jgi:hypothetical protein
MGPANPCSSKSPIDHEFGGEICHWPPVLVSARGHGAHRASTTTVTSTRRCSMCGPGYRTLQKDHQDRSRTKPPPFRPEAPLEASQNNQHPPNASTLRGGEGGTAPGQEICKSPFGKTPESLIRRESRFVDSVWFGTTLNPSPTRSGTFIFAAVKTQRRSRMMTKRDADGPNQLRSGVNRSGKNSTLDRATDSTIRR